jgi:hypothetical protein
LKEGGGSGGKGERKRINAELKEGRGGNGEFVERGRTRGWIEWIYHRGHRGRSAEVTEKQRGRITQRRRGRRVGKKIPTRKRREGHPAKDLSTAVCGKRRPPLRMTVGS